MATFAEGEPLSTKVSLCAIFSIPFVIFTLGILSNKNQEIGKIANILGFFLLILGLCLVGVLIKRGNTQNDTEKDTLKNRRIIQTESPEAAVVISKNPMDPMIQTEAMQALKEPLLSPGGSF